MSRTVPSHREFFSFFAPLALQAMSQSITYPLVAMVASRGPGGPLNLAGLAQSNTFMFFVSTLGSGLLTTGMVYGKTVEGFARYVSVNRLIMILVCSIQAVFCIPVLSHLAFGTLMGLPPSIEAPARQTFLACIPLQLIFFLRNPYQVILYNARETGKAYMATVGRIMLTLALSPVFSSVGLVGPTWAAVCLTVPVILETVISYYLALPYSRRLSPCRGPVPAHGELLKFTLTFSIGSFFLALSGYLVASFIARAAGPEVMLPVYYMAVGVVNPFSFATSRLQALVLSYSGNAAINRKLQRFALVTGTLAGVLPLLFIIPGPAEGYYVALQKLAPENLGFVRQTALAFILVPLAVSMRAFGEGRAAYYKKPLTVLTGQAVFLGVVATSAFFTLNLGVAGNLIGPAALLLGNAAAAGAIALSLAWEKQSDLPVPVSLQSQSDR